MSPKSYHSLNSPACSCVLSLFRLLRIRLLISRADPSIAFSTIPCLRKLGLGDAVMRCPQRFPDFLAAGNHPRVIPVGLDVPNKIFLFRPGPTFGFLLEEIPDCRVASSPIWLKSVSLCCIVFHLTVTVENDRRNVNQNLSRSPVYQGKAPVAQLDRASDYGSEG